VRRDLLSCIQGVIITCACEPSLAGNLSTMLLEPTLVRGLTLLRGCSPSSIEDYIFAIPSSFPPSFSVPPSFHSLHRFPRSPRRLSSLLRATSYPAPHSPSEWGLIKGCVTECADDGTINQSLSNPPPMTCCQHAQLRKG